MARKPGKLPAEVMEETYAKEYGTDTIQIHKDAITEDDVSVCTTTCWLPEEQWQQLTVWFKNAERKKHLSTS